MPRIAPRPIESLPADQRETIEHLVRSNKVSSPVGLLINAHSARMIGNALAASENFPHMGYDKIFGQDFCELLRLRSAQLGGCDSCSQARYTPNSEELVCQINLPTSLGPREKLALRLLTLMHTDHHAIDRDFFVELAEEFSTSEIVELGSMIAAMVGTHRWLHALDLLGSEPPACGMEAV